jgi:hypothetical protein
MPLPTHRNGNTRLVPSRSSPHFFSTFSAISKAAHPIASALAHPSRTYSQHISGRKTHPDIRSAYESGCLSLSAPVPNTFEHKASLTPNDWQKLVEFEDWFVREHICDYCKNCKRHGTTRPLLQKSATTALLPLPASQLQVKPRSHSRNPLKVITNNFTHFSSRFRKSRESSPVFSIAEDQFKPYIHTETGVLPPCTCCTQSLRRRMDPLLQASESHERSTIPRTNRFDREIENDLNTTENLESGNVFRTWVNKTRMDGIDYHPEQLVVEGEEQASRFMALVTSPSFDTHSVKSVHIVMNANDWNPRLDDYLAIGLRAFADEHSIRELRIWIKGNTLFTRMNYTLTAVNMRFHKTKEDFKVANKYSYWQRVYDGTATRESLSQCPPNVRKTTKAVVKALLSLRNIPTVYVHGVMESDLKQDIISICSGNSIRPLASLDDLQESMNIIQLADECPIRYRTSLDGSQSDSIEVQSNTNSTPPRNGRTISKRRSPRRSKTPPEKLQNALLAEFESDSIEKIVLDVSGITNLAPGGADEVVRISSHQCEPEDFKGINISSSANKETRWTQVRVLDNMLGDCELGWKVVVGEDGAVKVGREDEFDRPRHK